VKAGADDTDGAFSLLEADEPAGFGPPLHIHHDAAESFYVLAGEDLIYVEDEHLSKIARRYSMEVVGPVPETYA
jgi:mannose-6-phosphate isomerase-like protein (cupin superfamily)